METPRWLRTAMGQKRADGGKPPAQGRVRRWRVIMGRVALGIAALVAGWLVLVLHPQPLFAYSSSRGNIVLHARVPLEAHGGRLLDDVVHRISRSPLHDPERLHHVFLCDSPALFAFFEPWQRNVGGIAQVHLGGNVFIRPFNLSRNTVIGPSGNEKTGERTLAYYIAHEVTHAMTADHLGRLRYFRLPAFLVEGYADYIGMARAVDFAAGRAALKRDDAAMNPRLSGLYRRYELLVAFLLEREHASIGELFSRPPEQGAVERRLLASSDP